MNALTPRAWGITILCLAAAAALRVLPMPGIEQEALASAMASPGALGLLNVPIPPVGLLAQNAFITFFVIRIAVLLLGSDKKIFLQIGVGTNVLVSIAGAWTVAVVAESTADGVATHPGLMFRVVTMLTCAAAAVLLWFLTECISRWGVGTGIFVVTGAYTLVDGALTLANTGPMFQLRATFDLRVVASLLAAFAIAGLALRLASRTYGVWPVRIGTRVELTSIVDALAFPTMAGWLVAVLLMVVTNAAVTVSNLVGRDATYAVPEWIAQISVLHVFGTFAACIVVGSAVPRSTPRKISATLFSLGIVQIVGAISLVAISMAASGALASLTAHGPFYGPNNVTLRLHAFLPGDCQHDATAMVRRLREFGVRAEALCVDRSMIELQLHEVGDTRELLAIAGEPRRFAIRLVSLDQHLLDDAASQGLPDGVTERLDYDGSTIVGAPTAALLKPLLQRVPTASRRDIAIECRSEDNGADACSPFVLEPVLLDGSSIAEARVAFDPTTSRPYIAVTFDEQGAEAFERITAANVRRKLAMTLDDIILMSPMILSAIPGGHAQISLARSADYESMLAEASAIATTLQGEPLTTRWTLADDATP